MLELVTSFQIEAEEAQTIQHLLGLIRYGKHQDRGRGSEKDVIADVCERDWGC